MATNKNQHFVPRCYLKAFSKNGDGLAINLFNIDRMILIKDAPLKHQCSKDYFYGNDPKLENALQFTEGAYGNVIREILKPGYIFTDNHKRFLKLFWLLQYLRTESASRRSVEMFEGVKNTIGEGMPEGFGISIKEAVLQAMHVFHSEMHIIDDLRTCLIKNKSDIEFITSDDPAIIANRWHQTDQRGRITGFGLNSSGMLALLPLSKDILFVAYDGDVYSIPNQNGWANFKGESDARNFNQFQYLNCRANIFVRDPESENEIRTSLAYTLPNRPQARHIINYAILDKSEEGYDRYVVATPQEAKKCGSSGGSVGGKCI